VFHIHDYHIRDRAFSWDLPIDENLRKRSNSFVDISMGCFDSMEPAYKKQNIRVDPGAVASVQLESGSGATTVMPVYHQGTGGDCDSGSVKIGAYTREERQILIEKFRAKKKRRVWRKQIKYDCRKRLADTRPRVKGRFVSRKDKDGNSDGDSEEAHPIECEDMASFDDEV
jgi:hypothetical protein